MNRGPSIELIETTFQRKRMNMVLFRDEKSALIDTGTVTTPENYILPEFERIDFDPKQLTWVINTHAHSDHFGGNEQIYLASGCKTCFCAHQLDTAWIENPQKYTEQFHRHHVDSGVINDDVLDEIKADSGNGIKISKILKGGECFKLGNIELEIFFLPSHTPGNIAVFEKNSKVFIIGETIGSDAQLDTEGNILAVPYYHSVEAYLETIKLFSKINFQKVIHAHLPVMDRLETLAFLKKSVHFVLDFDSHIKNIFKNNKPPLLAIDIWNQSNNLFGKFQKELCMYMLIETHLKSLVKRNVITNSQKGFTWINDSHDNLESFIKDVLSSIPGM